MFVASTNDFSDLELSPASGYDGYGFRIEDDDDDREEVDYNVYNGSSLNGGTSLRTHGTMALNGGASLRTHGTMASESSYVYISSDSESDQPSSESAQPSNASNRSLTKFSSINLVDAPVVVLDVCSLNSLSILLIVIDLILYVKSVININIINLFLK